MTLSQLKIIKYLLALLPDYEQLTRVQNFPLKFGAVAQKMTSNFR